MQADVVDPKPQIEKECHKPCDKEWSQYEKCKERIKAKGEGTCEPWAFDYWKCIDKCVSVDAANSLNPC
jgi:ubiquinol-cytochrome c reductase subunit 6